METVKNFTGLSKITLIRDDSELPTDMDYTFTSNKVFAKVTVRNFCEGKMKKVTVIVDLDHDGYYEEVEWGFLNPKFFVIRPAETAFIECCGTKCRRECDLVTNNVWCESCHGDINDNFLENVEAVLKRHISLAEINEHYVKFVKVTEKPIDETRLKQFINDCKVQDRDIMESITRLKKTLTRLECQNHPFLHNYKQHVKTNQAENQ